MVKKVSIWTVLEPLLFSEPRHLAEISRELGKSHTTVAKQLAIFEEFGLIEKESRGKQVFYKLKNVPLLIDYLTIVEKERLLKRCEEELVLKEVVAFFHKFSNLVLMFGSAVYSVKQAKDIDVLVVGEFDEENIKLLEEKLNVKLHILNVDSLNEVNKSLKEEIKNKHLLINGSEIILKWLIN